MTENRKLLIIILALYILLAAGYGVAVPLFEAPDEHHHFFTIRLIADTGTLPTIDTGGEFVRQEAAQPPLYYLISAPILALIDTSDAEEQLWFNPTVKNGIALPINANDFIHTERESWPWQGYPLAAHLVRGVSTLIGLGTLLSIFGSGRLLWPRKPQIALLATALVAFLPQFAFLHGAITNDVLVIFLCSCALWQLLWIWENQVTSPRLLLLGTTIGLAVLSKMAGLLLLPLAMLVLALIVWRDRRDRVDVDQDSARAWWWELLRSALLVGAPALLISGWLLWRNWVNYGDPTAANQFVAMAGTDRQFTLRQVWHDMDRVAKSAVGYFGWMNVLSPGWLYLIWSAIVLLAGGGWLFSAWNKRGGPDDKEKNSLTAGADRWLIPFWMGSWVLLVFAAWLRFMMQTPADQGRLLFPALLPVALFTARGLVSWRLRWLPWLVAIVAFFTSAYALLVIIPGAYDTAELLTEQEIPPEAGRFELDMGQGIELVAVEAVTEEIVPGEWAWVDLYWRAAAAPDYAPLQGLGLYGRNGDLVGRQVNYHGGGSYPATLWPVGQIVKDRAGVRLAPDAELPAQLRLLLRINDEYEPVEIARVKATPHKWPEPEQTLLATFGDGIDLTAASFAQTEADGVPAVQVGVQWLVKEAPGRELTTFVHLGDPTQAPLAQGDGPALGGDYPTDLWAEGEVINDRYELLIPADLPAGSYPLHIGFYDPQSGARLAVEVNGQAQPNDAYYLGMLDIETVE